MSGRSRPSAAGVADGFRRWAGAVPDGVWRAPGRINLIGEHLDYNGGHVLPFAIDRAVWLAARRIPAPVLRLRSAQIDGDVVVPLDALERATGWSAYPAGVLWALGEIGVPPSGLEVYVDGDVPLGGGLSSSAALGCAVALAVADLGGRPTDGDANRHGLARAAQRAEAVVAGAPVGSMDQIASLLAREGHALHLATRSLDVEHVPLPLTGAGYTLLVVDTGHPHSHTADQYAERRRTCEQAAAALGLVWLADAAGPDLRALEAGRHPTATVRRVRHVVSEEARTEAAVVALAEGRLDEVGTLMTASHRSLQHDFECSTDALDAVVDAAVDAGAAGARMTGGGWGGAAIVLVTTRGVDAVTAAVDTALRSRGLDAVEPFDVTPSAGARRVA